MQRSAILLAAILLSGTAAMAQDVETSSVPQNAFSQSELVGQNVLDVAGQKVGRVSDLVIDADQRVEAVVVEVGGFLGMGATPVLLETASLQQEGDGTIRVGLSREQLDNLPPAE
ncbi:PRC-barrel domain-containing protein [Geminicoccus flavidas]|uniref:PRC-barrel domain-containing protein n=1 Tax=Geminicoccus flavidas TaxID=2506407 RepID=UPI00135BA894|nr:PRC-barrel domain-containing protein [Geminicoccus flavidas]